MSIQHMQMVFDAGDLTGSEKAVLLAYCNFTDAHGYTWAGVERVSDMTGFSEKTVKNVRSALKDRNFLRSSVRVERSGRRKTDITRVNLTKLASLKMPPREYKDNVIAELEFEDEAAPETAADQAKGSTCPEPDQPRGSSYPYQGKQVPLQEGEAAAPNPSGDPSSSSGPAPEPPKQRTPEDDEKKTKSFEEQAAEAVTARLSGAPGGPPTAEETAKILEHVRSKAKAPINRIHTYVNGRDQATLLADLAHVRHHAGGRNGAQPDVCRNHPGRKTLPCRPCQIGARTGDWEPIEAELARAGAQARPDLAELIAERDTAAA